MKKLTILTAFIAVLIAGCSPKYIKDGSVISGFSFKQTYKIAVLTPYVSGMSDMNYAYRLGDHAILRIMEARRLVPSNKFEMRQMEQAKGIGHFKQPSPFEATGIARQLGADLVMITEIGTQPVAGDKLAPLYCSVSIIEVSTGNQIYPGNGRTANPVSKEAAGEWLIDLATDVFIKGFK